LSHFPSEKTKALMALSLSKFEQGKYVVKVRSALLGEDIYFVSNEKLLERVPEGFVVYTAKELRALKGSTKDDIKNVHRTKKTFNGEIIS
jgi:glutamate 5-kinase